MDEALRHATRDALLELSRDGSPVVRVDAVDEILALAWRRWSSYERRTQPRRGDPAARTEDLAKGLRDAFEADPKLAGPLMEDYRYLAGVLNDHFAGDR